MVWYVVAASIVIVAAQIVAARVILRKIEAAYARISGLEWRN